MSSGLRATGFLARGGGWVIAQFTLMLAVIILGVVFAGAGKRTHWVTNASAGLFALGAAYGIAGASVLGRNRTAYPRPLADAPLVQHGVYAYVRHPLYTSVMLLALGWALIWLSWPALLAALALMTLLIAKARREEAWLTEKYPGYADYARRVPRFFPRFWGGGKSPL